MMSDDADFICALCDTPIYCLPRRYDAVPICHMCRTFCHIDGHWHGGHDPALPIRRNDGLPMWTVYDHPSDFPECYVARKFLAHAEGAVATDEIIVCEDLTAIREVLAVKGLTPLMRNEEDDARIIETWV